MKALRDIVCEFLIETARTNDDVVAIDIDAKTHSKLDKFEAHFPDRFFQSGISEQNAIGMAAGLAKAGKTVVVGGFSAFIGPRAYEQLRHSIGLQNLPMLVVGTHAGVSACEDGPSHQSFDDIALFRLIPAFRVFSPGDAADIRECLSDFFVSPRPTYIRIGRLAQPDLPHPEQSNSFRLVCGNGEIALLATGEITHLVRQAILDNDLESKFRLFHVASIEPLPAIPKWISDRSELLTFEDHYSTGGLFSAIVETNAGFELPKRVIPIAARRRTGETGDEAHLRSVMGIGRDDILQVLRRAINRQAQIE